MKNKEPIQEWLASPPEWAEIRRAYENGEVVLSPPIHPIWLEIASAAYGVVGEKGPRIRYKNELVHPLVYNNFFAPDVLKVTPKIYAWVSKGVIIKGMDVLVVSGLKESEICDFLPELQKSEQLDIEKITFQKTIGVQFVIKRILNCKGYTLISIKSYYEYGGSNESVLIHPVPSDEFTWKLMEIIYERFDPYIYIRRFTHDS